MEDDSIGRVNGTALEKSKKSVANGIFQQVVFKVKLQQKEAIAVALWADSNLPDRITIVVVVKVAIISTMVNQNLRFILDFCSGKGPKCESGAAASEPVKARSLEVVQAQNNIVMLS